MNRKYNKSEFVRKIENIRKVRPDISITTDVIVGFPGETEELFNETVETINKIRFSKLHVFPYSRRSGTKADQLEGHLSKNVITLRAKQIGELAKELKKDYINNYINTSVYVLAETSKGKYWHGHTSNYLDVYFESKENLENKIIKVRITSYENDKIYGEMEEIYE
jgi:threonylcarbamoyladenosine tRNA methylthiotransferase MtaB